MQVGIFYIDKYFWEQKTKLGEMFVIIKQEKLN